MFGVGRIVAHYLALVVVFNLCGFCASVSLICRLCGWICLFGVGLYMGSIFCGGVLLLAQFYGCFIWRCGVAFRRFCFLGL